MLKKLTSVVIILSSLLATTAVKAESSVDELLKQALTNKTFYDYNMAAAAIMKIQDIKIRDPYLWKLGTITNEVLTPAVNSFTKKLEVLRDTSSGRLYDEIVADVTNSNLGNMDKGYLLGELTGWGRKLVYSPDYTAAVDKLVIAWNSLNDSTINYDNAVTEASNAISNVINSLNKDYLKEQLQVLKNKHDSMQVPVDTNKYGYVNNSFLNVRSIPSVDGNEPIGKLFYYNKVTIVGTEGSWYKIVYGDGFAYVHNSYIQVYTSPASNVIDIARNITKNFEVGTSIQVAGNFDGTGLSLGQYQWSLGVGSLQPLLSRMDEQYNGVMRQIFSGSNYDSIHGMLETSLDMQLQWARSINDPQNKMLEPWYSQFIALSNTPEFKEIEKDAEVLIINRAMSICNKYNLKTVRGFALAFDIAVQNGSIVPAASSIIDTAIQLNPSISEKDLLKVIANAVADASTNSAEDVRARKMAIVNGSGMVHGSMMYLDIDINLSDNNWR
jgi:hypothetical protein